MIQQSEEDHLPRNFCHLCDWSSKVAAMRDDDDFHLVIWKKIRSSNLLLFSTFLCFSKTILTSGSNSGTFRRGKSVLFL